jgi:hypothetical protein
MSKSTNTVVYFDWKTVIYIYAYGKCRTQFLLPMEKSVTFTGACANKIIPSINRSFVYKTKEGIRYWLYIVCVPQLITSNITRGSTDIEIMVVTWLFISNLIAPLNLEDLLFVLILYSMGRENYFTLPWYLKWIIRENTWWYDKINSFVTYRPIENCRNMLLSKVLKCRNSNRPIPKWMRLLQLAHGWWEESTGAWLSWVTKDAACVASLFML